MKAGRVSALTGTTAERDSRKEPAGLPQIRLDIAGCLPEYPDTRGLCTHRGGVKVYQRGLIGVLRKSGFQTQPTPPSAASGLL